MKWLVSFLLGAVVGAIGMYFVGLQLASAPDPIVTEAAVRPSPAPVSAPSGGEAGAGVSSTTDGNVIPTDLRDAELPIHPAAHATSATPAAPELTAGGTMPAKLLVPVEGVAYSTLTDTFDQPRGQERHHEALDIMAPKGTPVRAVGDGKVVKLFESRAGGTTLYQFDPEGKHAYYYAHLDRYADGIKEGMQLKRGDLIGYVGVTGNSDPNAPHLHFAVVALTPEKQWWKGTPVNPYPLLGD
jgi:murein DD-endopeptidase MepM/ murein hydrolase activator NlpD